MGKKRLYIVRHGQTDYNAKGIIQGSGINSNLDKKGREQASAFYDAYRNEKFDRIYHSDLQRTKQTVSQWYDHDEVEIVEEARIREINWGIHEGEAYDTELTKDYLRVTKAWSEGLLDERMEEAESAQELFDRLEDFVADLDKVDAEKVLICSHGRTIRALITVLTNSHPSAMNDFSHKNCGLYVIDWDGSHAELLKRNDCRHLDKIQDK